VAKGRFLVAPFDSGLVEDKRPWLIPEDAFDQMSNAYVFRGRVRKRPGTTLLNDGTSARETTTEQISARLRISVGSTDLNGDLNDFVPLDGGTPITANIGSMFSIGNYIYTVYQATGDMYDSNTASPATTATFNTTTGEFDFVGAAASSTVYFYPAEPVMGIVQYETILINDEPTYAFDTKFAYQYANNGY